MASRTASNGSMPPSPSFKTPRKRADTLRNPPPKPIKLPKPPPGLLRASAAIANFVNSINLDDPRLTGELRVANQYAVELLGKLSSTDLSALTSLPNTRSGRNRAPNAPSSLDIRKFHEMRQEFESKLRIRVNDTRTTPPPGTVSRTVSPQSPATIIYNPLEIVQNEENPVEAMEWVTDEEQPTKAPKQPRTPLKRKSPAVQRTSHAKILRTLTKISSAMTSAASRVASGTDWVLGIENLTSIRTANDFSPEPRSLQPYVTEIEDEQRNSTPTTHQILHPQLTLHTTTPPTPSPISPIHTEFPCTFPDYTPTTIRTTTTDNSPWSSTIDIEDMSPEDLKRLIESALEPLVTKNTQMEATLINLTEKTTAITEEQMSARKSELQAKAANIERELKAIEDKTWTAPFTLPETMLSALTVRRRSRSPSRRHAKFDGYSLPKFVKGDDLEQWIAEMQLEIGTHGEEFVCPQIWKYCFPQDTVVRLWWSMLPADLIGYMTTGKDCWEKFKTKMRQKWNVPVAIQQIEAAARVKQPHESYQEYYFAKLRLLTSAFPEESAPTLITRIRLGLNNAEADKFIKERRDIVAFGDECQDFDEHVMIYPTDGRPKISDSRLRIPSQSNSSYIKSGKASASSSRNIEKPSERLQIVGNEIGAPKQDRRRIDRRLATLEDRRNPAGQLVRSFVRSDGTVRFIEHACDVCEKNGKKDQMHFRFKCPANNRNATKTYVATPVSDDETDDSDDDQGNESGSQ